MTTNHPTPLPERRAPRRALPAGAASGAALAALLLAACGGSGSDSDSASTVSTENAQGYAADAATMPTTAGTAMSAAALTLQTAVVSATAGTGSGSAKPAGTAAAPAAAGQVRALDTTGTYSVACVLGGNVSWVASGLPLAQLINARLDAGETYDITYNNCATAITGVVLSGSLRIVVNAADSTGFDLATTSTALTATTTQGRFVLEGSWRHQLSATTTGNGGTQRVNRLTTPLTTVASTVGTRQARYELRNMDWTVTDLWNSGGQFVSRSHIGTLELFASAPRRPSATLQVATIGTLAIGADGLADSGGFSIVAGGDRWSVTYSATTVTIALDIGNNGSTERTWTLPRLTFYGEAG